MVMPKFKTLKNALIPISQNIHVGALSASAIHHKQIKVII
jgi:hypothetical protein